tara:strand:+ start:19948 stop:20598 length:651 start_codon:yes stop_codon:yes gene_type:complete
MKFPNAIVFDFDGVILESTEIKTQAFVDIFSDETDHLDSIIRHHLENMGISRHEKFRYIYKNILKRELTQDHSEKLAQMFALSVWKNILDCPEVPGIIDFLKMHSKNCLFFIASGTPEEELKEVVKQRRLDNYFVGVYGSPRLKPEIIHDIIQKWNLKINEMLFIGDALTDLNAARECNISFVGRIAPTGNNFTNEDVITIDDFRELPSFLNSSAS